MKEKKTAEGKASGGRARSGTQTVLITGIGRQLGKILAKRLDESCRVVGLGRKEWIGGKPSSIKADAVSLERNRAEDLFRRQSVDTVVHLEYVHSPGLPVATRYRINVVGTMRLLEFCRKYGVKKVVVLSTAHVYGALADNHPFIEEEDPVRAEQDYSALRQVIEVDTYVRSWMYRYRDIRTVILRPCNIVGPTIRNSMIRYLGRRACVTLLGFDPMMQFIHEEDMAEALALAVEKKNAAGIFNIAGPGVIPLSRAIREAGAVSIPVFHPLVYGSTKVLWPLGLPSPEIDYLRYPCLVATKRAEKILGFKPRYSLLETIRSVRR
jgi:UDP-glucose 4-epimerase